MHDKILINVYLISADKLRIKFDKFQESTYTPTIDFDKSTR